MHPKWFALVLLCTSPALAQERTAMEKVLERLERLEEQNRQMLEEIRLLRQQLAPPAPSAEAATPAPQAAPVAERLDVQERRVEELEQSKVTAEQRLPVTLTGTVVFNAFLNGKFSGEPMNPTTATLAPGAASGGATMRQTMLGLRFRGPEIPGGGRVSGSLFLDLFAGTGTSLNQLMRLRVATLDMAWKKTTLSFSQDKPIIAPREPDSLAQVGVSPLTGAGNLWLWQPQVRVEQRFFFSENTGLRAQVGVYQTAEAGNGVPSEYAGTVQRSRPGLEGRFEFWGQRGARRFEIAPGFHASQTHVIGQSLPSRIYTVDWLVRPFSRVDVTGQFFQGENTGVVGGLRQGISFHDEYGGYEAYAVRSLGGWLQLRFRATERLSFHIYGGQEDPRNSDLRPLSIAKNQAYAANVMYRLWSNFLASFEVSQVRTTYLGAGTRRNPHYDLALAYLF